MANSDYNLQGKKVNNTYRELTRISGSNTPDLYDGFGNKITGIKMQEAFERNEDGSLTPTTGAFHDTFWEEDANGDKQPRDIKWWLDENYNLIPIPNVEE